MVQYVPPFSTAEGTIGFRLGFGGLVKFVVEEEAAETVGLCCPYL
jgi:hypothetical protein